MNQKKVYGEVRVGALVWDPSEYEINDDGSLLYVIGSQTYSSAYLDHALKAAKGLRKAFPEQQVVILVWEEDADFCEVLYEDGTRTRYVEPQKDYKSTCGRNEDGKQVIDYFDEDDNLLYTKPFIRLVQKVHS